MSFLFCSGDNEKADAFLLKLQVLPYSPLTDRQFKRIVHPKMRICWKLTHLQAIQDVDKFFLHWNRFGEILHYFTCSPMGATRMRVQMADKNSAIIHKNIYKRKQSKTVINMSVDFDLRGQQGIDISTGGNVIKHLNNGFVSYNHAVFHFTRCQLMDWSHVDYLRIIMVFSSAVWTLILMAPIHCRRIQWLSNWCNDKFL